MPRRVEGPRNDTRRRVAWGTVAKPGGRHCADRGSHDRAWRRAEALRTNGARQEIGCISGQCQHAKHQQSPGTDMLEALGPGNQQKPEEQQRRARQERQEQPGQAGHHQDGAAGQREDLGVYDRFQSLSR